MRKDSLTGFTGIMALPTPWFQTSSLSVQFSRSVVSDSLWPPELQYTRDLCPSLSPRVCLNSCPVCLWCHPTISSSVPFSSCPQSFPASESFPMSQLFASGGQSIGASASVLPMNIQGWFPLGWTGLISLHNGLFPHKKSSPEVHPNDDLVKRIYL